MKWKPTSGPAEKSLRGGTAVSPLRSSPGTSGPSHAAEASRRPTRSRFRFEAEAPLRSRPGRLNRDGGARAAPFRPGFGPLIAARLVGEIAGAQRFATAAKLARAAGVAPIPASSGNNQRQRLDQGGNRQINAALHRVIVTCARCHPATQDYIARRRAEGKSTREAIRCLKRYLVGHVWRLLQPPHPAQGTPPSPSTS